MLIYFMKHQICLLLMSFCAYVTIVEGIGDDPMDGPKDLPKQHWSESNGLDETLERYVS